MKNTTKDLKKDLTRIAKQTITIDTLIDRQEAIKQTLDTFINVKKKDKLYGIDCLIALNNTINNSKNEHDIDIATKKKTMINLIIKDEIDMLARAMYIKYNLSNLYELEDFYYEVDTLLRGQLLYYDIRID